MLVLTTLGDHVVTHDATWRDRLRARIAGHRLDRELAAGLDPDSSLLHSLRARFLIAPDHRERIAAALESRVRQPSTPTSLAPARAHSRAREQRAAVLAQAAPELHHLARELRSAAPLDSRGVATVQLLVTDGLSLLHNGRDADALKEQLRATTALLRRQRDIGI